MIYRPLGVDFWLLRVDFEPLEVDFGPLGVNLSPWESTLGLWESILDFGNQFRIQDVDTGYLVVDFGSLPISASRF